MQALFDEPARPLAFGPPDSYSSSAPLVRSETSLTSFETSGLCLLTWRWMEPVFWLLCLWLFWTCV